MVGGRDSTVGYLNIGGGGGGRGGGRTRAWGVICVGTMKVGKERGLRGGGLGGGGWESHCPGGGCCWGGSLERGVIIWSWGVGCKE